MDSYVITLKPDEELSNQIIWIKENIYSDYGNQLYLRDEPHITLYLGKFNDISSFEMELEQFISEIDKNKFTIDITEWEIFGKDPVTKKDTLVCIIGKEAIPALKALQQWIISAIMPYRKTELIQRYKLRYGEIKGIQKENLDRYGYPFVGDIWVPHIGIASFDPDIFEKMWPAYRQKCPIGKYGVQSINIYKLDENTEKLELIREFPLKNDAEP
ncbi:MAG: 2'-5' RNA ligase family protein [Candidatus Woesearchaeota archaeon]